MFMGRCTTSPCRIMKRVHYVAPRSAGARFIGAMRGHGIEAVGGEGMAAEDAPATEPRSAPRAVDLHGFDHVGAARGREPAGGRQPRRDDALVAPDEEDHDATRERAKELHGSRSRSLKRRISAANDAEAALKSCARARSRGEATRSKPSGSSVRTRRKTSRNTRLIRFRPTEPSPRIGTIRPNRTGPGSRRTHAISRTSSRTDRLAARTRRNSGARRTFAVFGKERSGVGVSTARRIARRSAASA